MKRGIRIGNKEEMWVVFRAKVLPRTAARILVEFLKHAYAREMTGRYIGGQYRVFARYGYTGTLSEEVIEAMYEISLRAASGAAPEVTPPTITSDGQYVLKTPGHFSWAAKKVLCGVSWFSVAREHDGFVFGYTELPANKRMSWKEEL